MAQSIHATGAGAPGCSSARMRVRTQLHAHRRMTPRNVPGKGPPTNSAHKQAPHKEYGSREQTHHGAAHTTMYAQASHRVTSDVKRTQPHHTTRVHAAHKPSVWWLGDQKPSIWWL